MIPDQFFQITFGNTRFGLNFFQWFPETNPLSWESVTNGLLQLKQVKESFFSSSMARLFEYRGQALDTEHSFEEIFSIKWTTNNYENILNTSAWLIISKSDLKCGIFAEIVSNRSKMKDLGAQNGSVSEISTFRCKTNIPKPLWLVIACPELRWPNRYVRTPVCNVKKKQHRKKKLEMISKNPP